MIHVCYGLYDKSGHYSKFVGTSMASIFENTQEEATIHILHDNTLTVDNRDKFNYIAGCYKQHVRFYNVEMLFTDKIKLINDNFNYYLKECYSLATFYRLFLPDILVSLNKVIYLDADVVVNLDIKELWEIEITNKSLAAMPDINTETNMPLCIKGIVPSEDYFNAGVLLINLKRVRENNLINDVGFKFFFENINICTFLDQDILNYCFSKDYIKLPRKFNKFVASERNTKKCEIEYSIYHFAAKSLGINTKDVFNRMFFDYFKKTPWFNLDMFKNFFESIMNFNAQKQLYLIQSTAMLSGKLRAFFTESQNVEAIKKIFAVKEEEEVISLSLIPPPPRWII